jgi:hypothetical protein
MALPELIHSSNQYLNQSNSENSIARRASGSIIAQIRAEVEEISSMRNYQNRNRT